MQRRVLFCHLRWSAVRVSTPIRVFARRARYFAIRTTGTAPTSPSDNRDLVLATVMASKVYEGREEFVRSSPQLACKCQGVEPDWLLEDTGNTHRSHQFHHSVDRQESKEKKSVRHGQERTGRLASDHCVNATSQASSSPSSG